MVACFYLSYKQLLFSASEGGKVELWDLESGTSLRSVRGHDEDAVTAIKVTIVTTCNSERPVTCCKVKRRRVF